MTGRAAGYCAGYAVPGYMNPVGGQGFSGWGRGGGGRGGRGWRNRFYATGLTGWQQAAMGYPAFGGAVPVAAPYPASVPGAAMGYPAFGGAVPSVAPYAAPFAPAMSGEQQLEALKGQAEYFEDALDGIRKRIDELEAKGKKG